MYLVIISFCEPFHLCVYFMCYFWTSLHVHFVILRHVQYHCPVMMTGALSQMYSLPCGLDVQYPYSCHLHVMPTWKKIVVVFFILCVILQYVWCNQCPFAFAFIWCHLLFPLWYLTSIHVPHAVLMLFFSSSAVRDSFAPHAVSKVSESWNLNKAFLSLIINLSGHLKNANPQKLFLIIKERWE